MATKSFISWTTLINVLQQSNKIAAENQIKDIKPTEDGHGLEIIYKD